MHCKEVLYLINKIVVKYAEVAQLVEQLICNQQVVGSTPFLGSVVYNLYNGQMAEWLKATDCKSVLSGVRRFEPYSAHSSFK
jgi:hypothetical protein